MVQKTNENLKILKKFKLNAGRLFKINKLILFGSRAKGTFNQESDFDLLVISNDFKKIPFYKRAQKLYLMWKENYPLELICYTEKEFNEKQKSKFNIVFEALKNGINI